MGSWIALVELALVLGAVLAFGVWQLVSLNRLKRDRERDGDGAGG